jgi:hypothetical protein
MDKLLSQEPKVQSFSQQDCSFVFLADVLPKALGETMVLHAVCSWYLLKAFDE